MSDIKAAIAVFLGATLVFHAVYLIPHFVLGKSPPKRFWTAVDYAWISMLLVSLVTAAAEVRVYFASGQLHLHERRTQSQFEFTQDYALQSQLYFCDHADDKNWPDETGPAAFQGACDWFAEMTDALEGGYDSRDWRDFLGQSRREPVDANLLVQQGKEHAIATLESLEEEYAALEEQRQRAKLSVPEEMLVFFWPGLLAVSLAIRVTKVTAELVHQSTDARSLESSLLADYETDQGGRPPQAGIQ